jgi:hypothetical protein
MASGSLLAKVRRLLGPLIKQRGFTIVAEGDQQSTVGACVQLHSSDFVVLVIRDRGQERMVVGTTTRPKPRAPIRSWPLGHVVAFLDDQSDPYPVSNLTTEACWLKDRPDEILDASLLNSEELREWAVRASRRLWDQRARR